MRLIPRPPQPPAAAARRSRPPGMPLFSNDIAGHSVVHHWNNLSRYHLNSLSTRGATSPWPERTEVCCWHCTEPFDTQPIGIPLKYDPSGSIVCDGNFCSYGCALTHIFSLRTTFREYQTKLMLLQVAREVHGIQGGVVPAPPRLALKKFGGHLDIEAFRAVTTQHSVVVNPPFVSQDIVCEEHDAASPGDGGPAEAGLAREAEPEAGGWQVTNLAPPARPLAADEVLCDSEPLGPPLFDAFVTSKQAEAAAPPAAPSAPDAVGGALGRFIRTTGRKRPPP